MTVSETGFILLCVGLTPKEMTMMHYRCSITELPRCANDRPTTRRDQLPTTTVPSKVVCKRCRNLAHLDNPLTPAVIAEAESRLEATA